MIIDHRTWHDPKSADHPTTQVMNEIYCQDTLQVTNQQSFDAVINERIKILEESLKREIKTPSMMVRIQTWSPTALRRATSSSRTTSRRQRTRSTPLYGQSSLFDEERGLHRAKIVIDGESYPICIDDSSLAVLQRGGDPTQAVPIYVAPESPLDHLHGLIR